MMYLHPRPWDFSSGFAHFFFSGSIFWWSTELLRRREEEMIWCAPSAKNRGRLCPWELLAVSRHHLYGWWCIGWERAVGTTALQFGCQFDLGVCG